MSRLLILCIFVGSLACDARPAPAPAGALAEEPSPAENKREGPPLAKNDPRFKPYVPKPPTPVDFSEIDVGSEPLDGAESSLDALGNSIVGALNDRDRGGLEALTITESEYKERFFPTTVNHVSGFGLGADLAWAELHGESSGDLSTALERFGGAGLTFIRFEVEEVVERAKVKLHRAPKLVVRSDSGTERTLSMLGSILEHTPSGGFKVLAFRDTG